MSRYSPDSWLDAVQFPVAMAQFEPFIYMERIAPDIRPTLCIVLALVLVAVVGARRFFPRSRSAKDGGPPPPDRAPPDLRSVYAGLVCAALVFVLWVVTSANGRYGLAATILTAPAILGLLCLVTKNHSIRIGVLAGATMLQMILVADSDPAVAGYSIGGQRWTGAYADRYPEAMVARWKKEAGSQRVLVVTVDYMTASTLQYQIFGPQAHYMGLNFIANHDSSSSEMRKAIEMVKQADVIYLAKALSPVDLGVSPGSHAAMLKRQEIKDVTDIQTSIPLIARTVLARFGISAPRNMQCSLMPMRMSANIQICRLANAKIPPVDPPEVTGPAYKVLLKLSKKCPSVFGDIHFDDPSGSTVYATTNDGKYYALVTKNMDVFIKYATKFRFVKILDREKIENLDHMRCGDFLSYGHQYW